MRNFLIVLLNFIISTSICSAQNRVEYCDVYARGSWHSMSITVNTREGSYTMNGNISTALNKLSDDGWVLDESIVIPRHPYFSFFTRHKLHFIMKRPYVENSQENASNNTTNIFDTSLMDKFSSGKIVKLSSTQQQNLENEFIEEIKSNISDANKEEDIRFIAAKINVLNYYNNSLSKPKFNITERIKDLNVLLQNKKQSIIQ